MWRWPDPHNKAHACCKQQWNKDTWCHHLEIHRQTLQTHQIVYVTSDADKLFLSQETCTALRVMSDNFPTVGETLHLGKAMALNEDPDGSQWTTPAAVPPTPETHLATAPATRHPPLKSTQLLFPATEANWQCLQTWLLNFYRPSMFNTCEHQHLPLMACVPMRLMVDANAKPVTHHTPIPVPLHWQPSVMAGLDHDVSVGTLEPVPLGEPVTWCHHVVICPKKGGQWISSCSTSTPCEKPTTCKAHFIRHVPYLVVLRRLSSTAGMATNQGVKLSFFPVATWLLNILKW